MAKETDEIFEGVDKREIVAQCFDNGDIVFFNEMLCEIGEYLYKGILQRSSYKNDYAIYTFIYKTFREG